MFPAESVILTDTAKCVDCGEALPLQVLSSAAGYYVGTFCPNCGPYSRETGYYRKPEQAEVELARMQAADLSGTRAVEAGLLGASSKEGGDA